MSAKAAIMSHLRAAQGLLVHTLGITNSAMFSVLPLSQALFVPAPQALSQRRQDGAIIS